MLETEVKLNYFKSLVTPRNGQAVADRKSWSIPLNSVLIPFFTASNVVGNTSVSREALGHPIRLATDTDGNVRFSKKGMPVYKIAKDITDSVKVIRENFIANMVDFANDVANGKETTELYVSEAKASVEAGNTLKAHETVTLAKAIQARNQSVVDQAIEHANNTEPVITERELVTA